MDTIYVNTVYWEGGETYRPFVTVNASKKWPTRKMAFYQSTGSSNNDNKNEYRKGTWLPTLGILQTDSALYADMKKEQITGYILKRNVFSEIFKISVANWVRAITTEMPYTVKFNYYKQIPEYLKNKIPSTKNITEEVKKVEDIIDVLGSYCQYWWQVQISAQLGEGLWEKTPEFRDFVLEYDYDDYTPQLNYTFTKRIVNLTTINVVYNIDKYTKDDANTVMDVLKKEDAIILHLLYGNYKEHKTELLEIFKKGLQKSKSKSPNETKKRKRTPSPSPSPSPIILRKKTTTKRPSPIILRKKTLTKKPSPITLRKKTTTKKPSRTAKTKK